MLSNVNVNVNNLLAISRLDFDNSGEPGPQAKGVNHLETPLRQLHATHRASSCAKRGGHVQLCSKPRGGTRNRARDLPKKGSAFITSSDHWTRKCLCSSPTGTTQNPGLSEGLSEGRVCTCQPHLPLRWPAFTWLTGPPSSHGWFACSPVAFIPQSCCLCLILFCTCPPLCYNRSGRCPSGSGSGVMPIHVDFLRKYCNSFSGSILHCVMESTRKQCDSCGVCRLWRVRLLIRVSEKLCQRVAGMRDVRVVLKCCNCW